MRLPPTVRARLIRFALALLVLVACFWRPLLELTLFSLDSELYSHIPLIPFISLYLIWLKRRELELHSQPSRTLALLPFAGGLTMLGGYWFAARSGRPLGGDDYLAFMTFTFLLFQLAGAFLFVGTRTLRTLSFPIAFLLFMVPFPDSVLAGIEFLLQHGSAEAAHLMFAVSGMPVLREGLQFLLPTNFSMQVAPECSGIHSTLVLFITSMVAGHLFLRSRWRRSALAFVVIPLALLRNGFRIFVIGQLCVHVSHDMIHSYIHRRGGPIFFALSLIPFFLILWLLRRAEAKAKLRNKGIESLR